jgi:hypothetical protein
MFPMRKAFLTAGVFCLLALAGSAQAATTCGQAICFNFTPAGQEFFNRVGLTQAQVQDRLNLELGRFFQTTDTAGFVRRFSDSQSFTGKGMGVDYASEATLLEVGMAGSVAMGIDRTYQPSSSGSGAGFPIQGVGLNASLMAGASLEPLGVPVMVFGNWMRISGASYGQLKGQLDNWGVHAQLRLFGPSRSASALKMLARWGGIAITTGVDSSHMNLRAGQTIKTDKIRFNDLAVDPTTTIDVSGSVNGQAGFELDMLTRSIPLEVTTSLRLLTLVTVYGGLGMDLQIGGDNNLKVKVSDATITGTVNGSSSTNLGTAEVEAGASASSSRTQVRGLLGAQVNLFLFRLFAQLNAANTDPVIASLVFGARLAY